MGRGRDGDPGVVEQRVLLFTDIEGSTRMLGAVGPDAYEVALLDHRSLMRVAMAAHGGVEQGTEGDGFFVTFPSAADAIGAAVDAQRALAEHRWPDAAPLRVRMGIHAGEVRSTREDLLGLSIHEAERVKSAAHGGQIVASALVRDLAGPAIDARVRLRSLGWHHLKDVAEPMELFQVCHPDLPGGFPPLRTGAVPTGLPGYRSAFIGRGREVEAVLTLLQEHRLVTLTGIGGCGKTRLAVEVARRADQDFLDGRHFVDLSGVADDDGLPGAVLTALGLTAGSRAIGGTAGATESPEDGVVRYLAPRTCLLVLDNCEHLLEALAALVDRLQGACPRLTVLATSREALLVDGEQTWAVPSLELPRGGVVESEAVALFVQRAMESRSSFELTPGNAQTVADLCRRLDGIPLAIEFAASRVRHLAPEQILEKLDDRFRLLTGGRSRVQRQQTLQATLDWSHDLLAPDEQVLLRRLAVFPSEMGADAVEVVCGTPPLDGADVTDLLGSLVAKSLVESSIAGDTIRHRLLETVRAYAADRLALAGEAEMLRDAHRDWVLAELEAESWDRLLSVDASEIPTSLPDVRAALTWSHASGRLDLVARLFARTTNHWVGMGMFEERKRWTDALTPIETELDFDERTLLLLSQLIDARAERRMRGTVSSADRAVAVAAGGAHRVIHAHALTARSYLRTISGSLTGNQQLIKEAEGDIAQAIELVAGLDAMHAAHGLSVQGMNRMITGDLSGAAASLSAADDELRRRAEAPLSTRIHLAVHLAASLLALGELEHATSHLEDALATVPAGTPDWGRVGTIAAVTGATDPLAATARLLDAYDAVIRSPLDGAIEEWLTGAAAVIIQMGDVDTGARLLSWVRSVTLDRGLPNRNPANYVVYRHYVALARAALAPERARLARAAGGKLDQHSAVALALDSLRRGG